jgi:hypothetical protein
MVEEQEVTMAASIGTMEGVGIAALEVFETAGFNQIGQLKAFNGDEMHQYYLQSKERRSNCICACRIHVPDHNSIKRKLLD